MLAMIVVGLAVLTVVSIGVYIFIHHAKRTKAVDLVPPCVAIAGLGIILINVALFGYPNYRVWQQEKEGQAELAKAEQNRQIAIQEAKAKEESAKSLANAEIIRAEGIAKANAIISDSLQNNEAYIHYLWIEALKESKDQIIYIPTEAGIPITESQRMQKMSK